ncbi:motility associated factor glycosyltransferase family protein [Clostridium botulinum]|nr:motility associated factor glycosyltransferase family protein [Clostridium botulinum]NFS95614.1 motility associated factor glycosyltransferase family protein [Clostridium botulinum]
MEILTKYLQDIKNNSNINTDDIMLEESKDFKKILKVKLNGKFKYIGSKYKNQGDINEFCEKFKDINVETSIIVFGLSTGEHIEKLRKKIGEFNRILVVEPDKRILKKFLELESSREILQDDRISLVGIDNEQLKNSLHYFLGYLEDYNNFRFSVYVNYDQIYLLEFKDFLRSLEITLRFFQTNLATEIFYGENFMETYLKNLKYISESLTINEFKNKFNGFTAVLVSAGPSLEKNISELKTLNDNVIIICGNRTLKPLIDNGIKPHFMCAIDFSEPIYQMCSQYMDKCIPLVFTETTNNTLVKNQIGKKIFFQCGASKTNIKNIIFKDVDKLYSGGSVAHTCMDFARYLGCDKIIFIGQDLAYTNDKHHADITNIKYDDEVNYYCNLIEVEGIFGDKIYTSLSLKYFKEQFENYIKSHNNLTFVNSTEGGANIKGTIVMDLKTSLKKYCIKSAVKNKINKILEEVNGTIKLDVVRNNILENYSEIEKIYKNMKKANNSIENTLKTENLNEMNRTYELIKKLNYKIDNSSGIDLIDFLMCNIVSKTANNFRYKQSKSEVENLKKILKAFNAFYLVFMKYLEEVLPKIKQCIESLEDDRNEI